MVTEASQAPAAFAVGVALIGTVGWNRVQRFLGRSSIEPRPDDHDTDHDHDTELTLASVAPPSGAIGSPEATRVGDHSRT